MRLTKYLVGSVFALGVLFFAPDVHAAVINISANVQGFCWTVSGPVSGSGCNNYTSPVVPDGTYTMTSLTPPVIGGVQYYLASSTGANPQSGGNISWVGNFQPYPAPTGDMIIRSPSGTGTWTYDNIAVVTGATGDIYWSAQNATSCELYYNFNGGAYSLLINDPGPDGIYAGQAFPAAGTYVLWVNCWGPGGYAQIDGLAAIVSAPTNGSTFVSQTAVPTLTVGQSYPYSVTYRNSGNTTWVPGAACNGYRLGSANPYNNTTWGANRVELPTSIVPGQNLTLNFNIVAPSTPGTYNFQTQIVQECVQWIGSLSPNQAINVVPPAAPTVTASFSPTTVAWGGSSTLTWSSTGATSCTSPQIGTAGPSGSHVVNNLTVTTQYSMYCSGPGGNSAVTYQTVTVTGGPPVPTGTLEGRLNNVGAWTGANSNVPWNSTVEFRWTTANATFCYVSPLQALSGFNGPTQNPEYPSDGVEYGPIAASGTYNIQLICSGSGGTNVVVDTIQVTVTGAPVPSVDFRVNGSNGPVNLSHGSNMTGSWTVANVTSCAIYINGTPIASGITVSGSGPYGPFTAPFTARMECTNPYGPNVADEVIVNMTGTITINSSIPGLTWNLTGPQNYSTTDTVIPNAPFGAYTLTVPTMPGYSVTIGPCGAVMNLNATAAPCD